jgi:hypothetical protein
MRPTTCPLIAPRRLELNDEHKLTRSVTMTPRILAQGRRYYSLIYSLVSGAVH